MKVVYTGATDAQAKFGRGADPREFLTEGAEYTVTDKEVHSWHTVLTLSEFPDHKFNSVCFAEADWIAADIANNKDKPAQHKAHALKLQIKDGREFWL